MSDNNTLRRLPEWAPHEGVWVAWPWHADWGAQLGRVRDEFRAFCRTLSDPHPAHGIPRGEKLFVLVRSSEDKASAAIALKGLDPEFVRCDYDDIWLRDTGPLFVADSSGELVAVGFRFNAWGGKYSYRRDERVAAHVAEYLDVSIVHSTWVLEGGALEVDGEGTALTTRDAVLNKNRNPNLKPEQLEKTFAQLLGVRKVVWLEGSLRNDHTDGHVDTLARFVGPRTVVCMEPADPADPTPMSCDRSRRSFPTRPMPTGNLFAS